MMKDLSIAIRAAKEAGDFLKKHFDSKIKINSEVNKDIKLELDGLSEKIISEILINESGYPILGEESGLNKEIKKNSGYWIIDPLDGSLNFSRSLLINCVSIGLWKNDKPLLGVIYDFIQDNLFTGIVGKGASLNGKPIHVSNINKKNNSILCTGFPVYSDFDSDTLSSFIKEIQEFKKIRLLGSAAISLAYVAKGSVEAYKENNIAIWDVAAGIPIILAAGGKCIFEKGKDEYLLNVYAHNGNFK